MDAGPTRSALAGAANGTKPKHYSAGTWGPSAAIALTERDGVTWHGRLNG